jgi:putative ABC transport system permease protein
MNLVTIAYKSIRQRALASSLTALSVALGVTLMVAVLVINGIIDRMFSQTASGYELIVGPKGSPLQLVLNTVYRLSQPIENLPYRYYLQLKNDPRIEEAVPFALGDVTEEGAFPIVGTVSRYFELDYLPNKRFQIRGHKLSQPFDAVIGAQVARANRWDIGAQFTLVHGGADSGHVHDEKFTVVAVLAPTGTPNDKTVFVNLSGFYLIEGHDKPLDEAIKREADFFGEKLDQEEFQKRLAELKKQGHDHSAHDHSHASHDHHHFHDIPDVQKEVTAVLVRMKGSSYGVRVTRTINFQSELREGLQAQAVNPVQQIRWLMDNIVGNVRTLLVVLTGLIIVVSGVGIFVSIYNSMADRKREIAIMRALGARRETVFAIILTESIILCLGGGILGLLLGHGLVFAAAPIVGAKAGILLDPFAFEPLELVLFPVLLALASLIGFIPGLTAYRTDVAKTLSE